MAESPTTFASLLRKLRTEALLTQEELADAAGLSPRSISDLERGVNRTAHKETARLLADALGLTDSGRAEFEAVARGRMPGRPGTGRATATATGGVAAATRTLPRDIASFTGRQQELAQLAEAAAALDGVVNIHAIGGMAGVGKTAFAVHAAHRLAERFPAGQIFLPLHGHTPGQQPVDPADALASLLLTTGVPAGQVPHGLEARMALWRDRLAVKHLLLILDDAVSTEQVRPLLPGRGMVLVTSRRHLSALEDATAISLDILPPLEAAALLVRLSGRPGLSSDDTSVREITRLCGYLPLAIGMVARQLHHHPVWSAGARAAELSAARDRLELMATENLSVAAAFNLSYADLTANQQRLFRRLGVHPGADIDAYAAAALDGTDLPTARSGLEALYDQYLLAEPAQGRYRLHDLIREHARSLAERDEPDRDEATARLLDYYRHTAAHADALIARHAQPLADPAECTIPAAVPDIANREQALAWARVERANLIGCLDQATGLGQHAAVVALTAGLAGLLRHDGPWAEAIARYASALDAARHLGDQRSQANALSNIGIVLRLIGDYPGAAEALEEALGISRQLGDRLGEANALNYLGSLRRNAGDNQGAGNALEEALTIARDLGDRLGQAMALRTLGDVRRVIGDYPEAVRDLEEALGISRQLGDRLGQASALCYLGTARRMTGDYQEAVRDLEEALAISRDLDDRLGQAYALHFLGDVRRRAGDFSRAAWDLDEALGIYRDLGNRDGEAGALNLTGTLCRVRGDLSEAGSCHLHALNLAREIGNGWSEAMALAGLGRCAMAIGHAAQAETLLRQALDMFQRIGPAEVPDILAELNALTDTPPTD